MTAAVVAQVTWYSGTPSWTATASPDGSTILDPGDESIVSSDSTPCTGSLVVGVKAVACFVLRGAFSAGMVVVCCVSAACGEGLVKNTVIVEVALVVVSGVAIASSTTPNPLPKFPLSWLLVGDNGFVKNIVPVFGMVVVCCIVSEGVVVSFMRELDITDACQGLVKYIVNETFGGVCGVSIGKSE